MDQFRAQQQQRGPTGEQLTRSPQINELIRATLAFSEGNETPETVTAALEASQQFLDYLQNMFEQQRHIQPPSDTLERETPHIRENFQNLGDTLEKMRRMLSAWDTDGLLAAMEQARSSMNTVFSSIDALQAEEARRPVLSRSPYLNHLWQVGRAVQAGSMDKEIFRDLLEKMVTHHQQFSAQLLAAMPASAGEAQVAQERRQELEGALSEHAEGLVEAQKFFDGADVTVIESGLARANRGTERLFVLQEAITRAEQTSRLRPCIRCGAPNEPTDRACRQCGAALPAMAADSGSTVDVRLEEQMRNSGHVVTETTGGLMQMAQAIQSGIATPDQLLPVLDNLRQRLELTRQQFMVMQMPVATSEEMQAALDAMRQQFSEALDEMCDGLEALFRYVQSRQPTLLEQGLETFLCGADKLFAVQNMSMGGA